MVRLPPSEHCCCGKQVVKINDLLHFHSVPSALESSIGGVDWIGNKVAVNMRATMAMSKCRIAFILLFDPKRMISGMDFSVTSWAEAISFVSPS